MGRARKVDLKTAKEAALSAFWLNGYKGLGVRKLEELTGINRFALQTDFGGKNGLFLVILETYTRAWNDTFRDTLCAGNLDDLAAYFILRASGDARAEMNNGCLVFNTLGEDEPDSLEIHDAITQFMDTIESCFASALRNERADGTLCENLDIEEASQMLLSALIGMNMLIKAKQSNEAALPTALALKSTIMGWRAADQRR